MATTGALKTFFPEPIRRRTPAFLDRPRSLAEKVRARQRAIQKIALTDPLKFAAGLSVCIAVLAASYHAVERLSPGPMPIWELAVTTQVACEDGRPKLAPYATLHATLPGARTKANASAGRGKLPGARKRSKRIDFTLSRGLSWGRDGTLFLQSRKGAPLEPLGQVELRKIRCMQPLELEALGLSQQPGFEVTLPLWMDPARPVSLERSPKFSCIRGSDPRRDLGLLRNAHADDSPGQNQESLIRPAMAHAHAFGWTRATQDELHFGRGKTLLTVLGTNYNRYSSWLTCRLGEEQDESGSGES
jgi:hypothetical protein